MPFKTTIANLLENRNFIFLLAMAMGFVFPQWASWTESLTIPLLAFVMTLATLTIPLDIFRSPRAMLFPSLVGIVMSYVLLGNAIIGLSAWLIREEILWIGFVIMAAVPPAVAVIPFTSLLEGDVTYSLIGTVGAYLGALLIMPVMFIGLLGKNFADPYKLLMIMVMLIIIPLIASRVLIWKGFQSRIAPVKGLLTDWSFFLILYTLIGLNRDVIVSQPLAMLPVAFIVFATTFIMGYGIEWAGRFFHVPREKVVSLVMLGTMKNQGIAGGLALALFSREAALPAAMSSIFMILYFMWLDVRWQWALRKQPAKVLPQDT